MSASGICDAHAQTKAHTDDTAVSLIPVLAALCGGLTLLSVFWPDWIEALTGYDPGQHNGTVECLFVIALLPTAPYWRSRRRRPNGDDLDNG